MSGFDWPALMRAGLQGLRLTPDVFWRLTPAELAVMLGVDQVGPVMDRGRLDALLEMYPDKMRGIDDE